MTNKTRSKAATELKTIRLTPAQLKQFEALGGGQWLRQVLDGRAGKIKTAPKRRGHKK